MRKSVFEFSDFREILSHEFQCRFEDDPKYSTRAFSRDLGLRGAAINDVLAGRYGFSGKAAANIAIKLGLKNEEAHYFTSLVEMKHGRSVAIRNLAEKRVRKMRSMKGPFQALDDEQLNLFSNWFQPAILELITVFKGKIDEDTIAKKLGLRADEAREGLGNLVKLKIVSKKQDGYVRNLNFSLGERSTPQKKIRDFHREVVARSLDALDSQPISKRKFLTTVFSFDSNKIEQCRNDLDLVHDQMIEKFQTEKGANSVYTLSFQLVRLDK